LAFNACRTQSGSSVIEEFNAYRKKILTVVMMKICAGKIRIRKRTNWKFTGEGQVGM